MWIAKRNGNAYHVTNGNAPNGLRANSKIGLLRLICNNIAAKNDLINQGYIVITNEKERVYTEIHVNSNFQIIYTYRGYSN